jgi:hypothetical protein
MKSDRKAIVQIMSKMLDSRDDCGIYPTSTAYGELEILCESIRMEVLGWAYSYACTKLDSGEDLRLIDVPEIIKSYRKDFNKGE